MPGGTGLFTTFVGVTPGCRGTYRDDGVPDGVEEVLIGGTTAHTRTSSIPKSVSPVGIPPGAGGTALGSESGKRGQAMTISNFARGRTAAVVAGATVLVTLGGVGGAV